MGIKKAVPEPTSKDLSLASIGFDAWYEHEEGLTPRPEIVEDYRQQTLTLIRLANHYHSELLSLRLRTDAGDEEVEDLLESIHAPERSEKWLKLTGEMECLRNELREARKEVERLKERCLELQKRYAHACQHKGPYTEGVTQ